MLIAHYGKHFVREKNRCRPISIKPAPGYIVGIGWRD